MGAGEGGKCKKIFKKCISTPLVKFDVERNNFP